MTYSNVRPETHITRDYITLELYKLRNIERVWEDGSDIVVGTFKSGQRVMFYLVDLTISQHEIEKWVAHYQKKGFYTLFMFWADMMLPSNGERYIPDDWMRPILSLYGDKMYGYDVSNNEVFIFPVYFHAQPPYPDRQIRWGKTVRLQDLQTQTIHLETGQLNGQFRIAEFGRRGASSQANSQEPAPSAHRITLQAYYEILGLPLDANQDTIKQTYRALARQFHPDLNPTPEANTKMQDINHAYKQIMAQFDD